jgi:hypothetical protein
MENKQELKIDSKIAYEVALERLILKEKEIIELRALCGQFAEEIHNLQQLVEDLQKGK